MKVIIADDSDLMRERLKLILESQNNVTVVGEARNSIEAKKIIEQLKPDIVLLDIRMPGGSGLDVLQNIREAELKTYVIVLTNYPYPPYRKKCLEGGADYFLSKSEEFDKLGIVISEIQAKQIN